MPSNSASSQRLIADYGLWHMPHPAANRAPGAHADSAGIARFQAIVESDPDALCILDSAMGLVYANPVARTTFAIPDRLETWRLPAEIHRVHAEDLAQIEAAALAEGHVTLDARIQMPDGQWRWFVLSLRDLRQDPVINGFLVRLRDIDQQKRSDEAAQAAIALLQRQNQNKSAFLSTISHEFRTPLTSIIGYSEYLTANATRPDMVAEDAEVIHREATRLSRLVEDVLLMDRVDNGHISLNPQLLDINELVAAVAEAMRPLLTRHRLVLECDPALPHVRGDRDRLEQALTNLISNAVKFSDHGGAITVETAGMGGEIVISVRDEGMGIAPDDMERIFQRFERVETGIAGRTVGTGLGLAIVSEIAWLHHGRVTVESAIGEGSTFSITLPVSAP